MTEVIALGATVGARGHRLFSGRLDRGDLRWIERLAARAVDAPDGDFRDHDDIRSWSAGVAAELTAAR